MNKYPRIILTQYILNELAPGLQKEIGKAVQNDEQLKKHIEELRAQLHKENERFLKKFSPDVIVPQIEKKARLLNEKARKKRQPLFLFRRNFVAAFASVFAVIAIASVIMVNRSASLKTLELAGAQTSSEEFLAEDSPSDQSNIPEGYKDKDLAQRALTDNEVMYFNADESPAEKKAEDKKGDLGDIYFKAPASINGRFERLLEFQVSLSFEVKDIKETRKEFFTLIDRYGFIKNSNANDSVFTAVVYVKSAYLNKFLNEAEELGALSSETIEAIDHTEDNEWQKRIIRRENIRSERRKHALSGSPGRYNWSEREQDLAQSEDSMDKAQHEKWKIQDKIEWARVTMSFYVPREIEINVPSFKKTGIVLLNFFLKALNYLMYVLPAAAIGWLAWRLVRRILEKRGGE